MDLNFFQWLRDAIRRTVLMGVSDAMQSLGTPDDDDSVHPQIAAMLTQNAGESTSTAKTTRGTGRGRSSTPRKRLGKSLKELNPTEAPAAKGKAA